MHPVHEFDLPEPVASDIPRHDWGQDEIITLYELPFSDLLHRAHSLHRRHFNPNEVQLSTLLNIKSGGCPEDCAYCPQSARYQTGVEAEPLLAYEEVMAAAQEAATNGAGRFCLGAAWRSPKDKDLQQVEAMIKGIKSLGLESCVTLGMLEQHQAERLAAAGLDYYNHNLDTSAEYYEKIITTRTYADRLETLGHVRNAGINVCCGGILGMGETLADRASMLQTLANLPRHPESVPINLFVKVEGTPLQPDSGFDPFDLVKTVAVARILMPAARVRLSAGRSGMDDSLQALCFHAGANSIFYGEKLLTTENPQYGKDSALFARLGISSSQQ
ncbi:MAG: biotin synthase BioB [Gammaproteobacteria bacterium]